MSIMGLAGVGKVAVNVVNSNGKGPAERQSREMNEKTIVEIRNLVKDYGVRGFQTRVLRGIDLTVRKNDFIAIMGPSGSGKTTLLNILSSIDKPTFGEVLLDGRDITKLSNKELSRLRRDKIGFIFQDYNLLDTMSLKDNIVLPLSLNGVSGKECSRKAEELAEIFGLKEHLSKYPYQLSGGQKQRGAACRALITSPEIIFADEPTGALDSRSGKALLDALLQVNERGQATILMVTHDAYSASYARDVYILSDGVMMCRLSRGASSPGVSSPGGSSSGEMYQEEFFMGDNLQKEDIPGTDSREKGISGGDFQEKSISGTDSRGRGAAGAYSQEKSAPGNRKEFYDRIMETLVSMGGDFA